MKRFVLLIEDENGDRNYFPYDANDTIHAEDQALAEHGDNSSIITIFMEV